MESVPEGESKSITVSEQDNALLYVTIVIFININSNPAAFDAADSSSSTIQW